MAKVASLRHRGQRLTITFEDAPPLQITRGSQLARRLSPGDEIDAAELDQLRRDTIQRDAEETAARLLSVRPRSEAELRQRLQRRGLSDSVIDAVLTSFREQHYVDDRAFAKAWIEERLRIRPRSQRMLQAELRARGVDHDLIIATTASIDDATAALRIAKERAARFHGDWTAFERKVGRALQRSGFSYPVASRALREVWEARDPVPDQDGAPAHS